MSPLTSLSDPETPISPLLESARRIIAAHPVGALSRPQRTGEKSPLWIGPVALTPDGRHLVTLISRDSGTAAELLGWSEVEWMFTDRNEEARVRLRGRALLTATRIQFVRWASFLSRPARESLLGSSSRAHEFHAVVTEVHSLRVTVPSHSIDLQGDLPDPAYGSSIADGPQAEKPLWRPARHSNRDAAQVFGQPLAGQWGGTLPIPKHRFVSNGGPRCRRKRR